MNTQCSLRTHKQTMLHASGIHSALGDGQVPLFYDGHIPNATAEELKQYAEVIKALGGTYRD